MCQSMESTREYFAHLPKCSREWWVCFLATCDGVMTRFERTVCRVKKFFMVFTHSCEDITLESFSSGKVGDHSGSNYIKNLKIEEAIYASNDKGAKQKIVE